MSKVWNIIKVIFREESCQFIVSKEAAVTRKPIILLVEKEQQEKADNVIFTRK